MKLYYTNKQLSYEGDVVQGQAHGYGVYYLDNGQKRYEGEWKHDIADGKGVVYHSNGRPSYQGYFKNNLAHGAGKIFNEEGVLIYNGMLSRDHRHGIGTSYYPNGNREYDGDWKNGVKHGHGTLFGEDGHLVLYKGNWRCDLYDGYGELLHKGNIFQGTFKSGILVGKCDVLKASMRKIVYSGTVSNFLPHGMGTSFDINGFEIQRGKWSHGKIMGPGVRRVIVHGIMCLFNGNFVENMPHGDGTLLKDDGSEFIVGSCTFHNGRIKKLQWLF
jgi:hypothetical protein